MSTRTFTFNVQAAPTPSNWAANWLATSTVGQATLVPMTNTLDNVAMIGTYTPNGNYHLGDYSGGAYNPDFSTWGAMVVHGGGHSGTDNNGVFVADLTTATWAQVGASADLSAAGKFVDYPDDGAYRNSYDYFIRRGRNSTGWLAADRYDVSKFEFGANWDDITLNPREILPNQPGSAHTYDTMFILPPPLGGTKGSLIRTISTAVGVVTSSSTGISHRFDFATNSWSRYSSNACPWAAPAGVAFDRNTGRVWVMNTGTNAPALNYLDTTTGAWGSVSGNSGVINDGYVDNVVACWHSTRSIAIHASSPNAFSGITRFYWFSTTANQGTRREVTWTNVTSPPHFHTGAGTLCDIPELGKVFFYTAWDPDAYYLFTVPADPTQAWTWQRLTVISGQAPSSLSPAFRPTMYHRMDYSAKIKSIVWVTSQQGNENVFGGRVWCLRIVP